MRSACIVLVVLVSGCTKHNPASCCTTQDQCDSFGLSQIFTCQNGETCDSTGTCVLAQCASSAECAAPTPFCVGQLCVAACVSNNDCAAAPATPFCETDGSCGACLVTENCTVATPICDATTHACRTYAADAECSSQVCQASDGTCVPVEDIAYASSSGSDAGMCGLAAPCATISFAASTLSGARSTIHIVGASYSVGSAAVHLPSAATNLHATGAVVTRTTTGPVFDVLGGTSPTITLGGMTIGSGGTAALDISSGHVTLDNIHLLGPLTLATPGSVSAIHSTFEGGQSSCGASSVITIRESTMLAGITGQSCTLTMQRIRFENATVEAVHLMGGALILENSSFVSNGASAPIVTVDAPSVVLRFNTFVNLASTSAAPVDCGTTPTVISSNILGWSNTGPTCTTRYSLYNGTGTHGTMDIAADVSTFFVDLANKDLHLAPNSPAKGKADPALPVTTDLDGNTRPANPDIGAYEAP
jgi:hypothetical protein